MPDTIKLLDVYGGEYPEKEEGIWNIVVTNEFDVQYEIRNINPVAWYTTPTGTGQTPKEIFEDYAEAWQRRLVKRYRKVVAKLNAERYIVVEGDDVVDGWHRMVAFALENCTEVRAVDLSLPQE